MFRRWLTTRVGAPVNESKRESIKPTRILFKSDWPDNVPVLKAGETLTFQGGEHRTDYPTTEIIDANGQRTIVETPGLPAAVAFAAAEVVYDDLNASADDQLWTNKWTARMAQVLDARSVSLSTVDFPSELQPASKRTRVKEGKYVFSELPASLQKRVRYDPLNGKLEMSGLLNDKEIGDRTLTAAPPAVYILEPNIMTDEEKGDLLKLSTNAKWTEAVNALYQLTRNPSALQGQGYLVGLEPKVKRDMNGNALTQTNAAGEVSYQRDSAKPWPVRAFGPGLALLPNAGFLDPSGNLPAISYVTVAENNDPSMGGSPITLHIIQVKRDERYRGAIKTVLSDNVFDENVVLRHTGDFGAHANELQVRVVVSAR